MWEPTSGRRPFITHVYCRKKNSDQELFLTRLAGMVERFGVAMHGYLLMGDHSHLLVEPDEDNLSRAMQWLSVSYSQWFNRRHHCTGHLFQGHFKPFVVDWK
jgi:putative transposase